MQSNNITSNLSPSFKLVAKYFIASIAAYVILNILMLFNYDAIIGHYFQPKILALVHIATLGWITMIIFGALFQLVPVVLGVKLFSEQLGTIQFWIFTAGAAGLITGFWYFNTGWHLIGSAILLNIAILIFIVNLTVTFIKIKKWNITGVYLAAALFYLLITAVAGLLMAVNLGFPYLKGDHLQYLKLHAVVAMVGWIFMVIMGVSYKLIPMFSLSHNYSTKASVWAFILINIGLLGLNTVMHNKNLSFIYYLCIIITVLGILTYLYQIFLILKHRVRKTNDIAMKHSLVSFFMTAAALLLAMVLVFFHIKNFVVESRLIFIYGYVVFFGIFSTIIVGQLYKILPFLIWYHKYSSRVGIEKVPLLKDMFNSKIADIEFIVMLLGLILTIIGLATGASSIILAGFTFVCISSLLLAYNMITVFRT